MKSKKIKLQRQAQKSLVAHLKAKHPESFRSFFKNIKKLRNYSGTFYEEVGENCIRLSKSQKNDYLHCLKTQFSSFRFRYNRELLEIIFKKYNEELKYFPEIHNEELRKILSLDCSKIWRDNTPPEVISEILEYRNLQHEFLMLAYHLKVKKILNFLEDALSERSSGILREDTGNILSLTRTCEKDFLKLLEQDLLYLDTGHTGLKEPEVLEEEKTELIKQTRKAKLMLVNEIYDNLMLLSPEKSEAYLKRLRKDLDAKAGQLEQYEFDLLNRQEKIFVEPALQLQLRDREDIIGALKDLNARKLGLLKTLLKRIQDRLEDSREKPGEARNADRHGVTTKKVVYLFEELGFFYVDALTDRTNVVLGEMLSLVSGFSLKNLTSEVGKLTNPRYKKTPADLKAQKWAQELVRKFQGLPPSPL